MVGMGAAGRYDATDLETDWDCCWGGSCPGGGLDRGGSFVGWASAHADLALACDGCEEMMPVLGWYVWMIGYGVCVTFVRMG